MTPSPQKILLSGSGPVIFSLLLLFSGCGGSGSSGDAGEKVPPKTELESPASPVAPLTLPEAPLTDPQPGGEDSTGEPAASQDMQPPSAPLENQDRRSPGRTQVTAYRGEITFSTGPTALYRDGQVYRDLEPGTEVQPLDLLETGPGGQLEAEIRGPGVPGVLVSISPRSQFYLENTLLGNNQSTTVHLLTGRAVLTVNRLLGGAFTVRTEEAALSVRGTVLTVTVAPTLDVLVTCSEGAVEVSRGGKKAQAAPGRVVFHAPGEALDSLEVKADKLEAFEARWSKVLAQELEVLARIQLKDFARTFPQRLGVFESRYRELENLKATLDRWRDLASRNLQPDRRTLVLDKQVMAPTLLNLKKSLFFLERQLAWLGTLEGALSPAFLSSDLDGRPVRTVMNLALSQKDYLQAKFSRVRYAMALFARMDPGSPLGDFLTDLDQGEDILAPLPGAGAKDVLSR